jgi:hypothetical protein
VSLLGYHPPELGAGLWVAHSSRQRLPIAHRTAASATFLASPAPVQPNRATLCPVTHFRLLAFGIRDIWPSSIHNTPPVGIRDTAPSEIRDTTDRYGEAGRRLLNLDKGWGSELDVC